MKQHAITMLLGFVGGFIALLVPPTLAHAQVLLDTEPWMAWTDNTLTFNEQGLSEGYAVARLNSADPDTRPFSFNLWRSTATGSERANVGVNSGYNVQPGGGNEDQSESAFYWQLESHYDPNLSNTAPVFEWHLNYFGPTGTNASRPLEIDVEKDSGYIAWTTQANRMSFRSQSGREALSFVPGETDQDTQFALLGMSIIRRDGLALSVTDSTGTQTPFQVAANPNAIVMNGTVWLNGQHVYIGTDGCLRVAGP